MCKYPNMCADIHVCVHIIYRTYMCVVSCISGKGLI